MTPYIFASNACKAQDYLIDSSKIAILDGDHSILIPQVHDVEFVTDQAPNLAAGSQLVNRRGVIAQVIGTHSDVAKIYNHPDQVAYLKRMGKPQRYEPIRTPFVGVDYLNDMGFSARLFRQPDMTPAQHKHMPFARFLIYAFFATAELFQIFTDEEFLADLTEYVDDKQISMRKRLTTKTQPGQFGKNYIRMPWILELNGYRYAVQLTIHDACAIHGPGGLKAFYQATGVPCDAKDWARDTGMIARMDEAHWRFPDELKVYALGDLKVYDALRNNAERFRAIYKALDCEAYYKPPKLTIGATVEQLFQACIFRRFDLDPQAPRKEKEALLARLCTSATADTLKQLIRTTACLLSKVEGGRCYNNRPDTIREHGVLVDLDLSGCYADGLRSQLYPFGEPVIFDYPWAKDKPHYPSLREFLDVMEWNTDTCELVPGLWHARIGVQNGYSLTWPQDYFASWLEYNPKQIREKVYDRRIFDVDPTLQLDDESGVLKILQHDIQDATLTHDGVQWILSRCHAKQCAELLEHLEIRALIFYPASQRVVDIGSLLALQDDYKTKAPDARLKSLADRMGTTLYKQIRSHAWYAVNLGEMLMNTVLAYRQLANGEDELSKSLNKLFKLVANTTFGVLCSPHFATGNVTVAANVTSRGRTACWLMEKGLFGNQSITDGVQLNVNTVACGRHGRKLTASNLLNLDNEPNLVRLHIELHPLKGYRLIEYDETLTETSSKEYLPGLRCWTDSTHYETIPASEAKSWINTTTMKHLQEQFPGMDILHFPTTSIHALELRDGKPIFELLPRKGQFTFAMKAFYHTGVFAGAADHMLINPRTVEMKKRSYQQHEHTQHWAVRCENGQLVARARFQDIDPAREHFNDIYEHPTWIEISDVFLKKGILKASEFQNGRLHGEGRKRMEGRYATTILVIGDDIWKQGLLKEWSISQMPFQTIQQFKDILHECTRCRLRYNWYVEPYFLLDERTLAYEDMIHTTTKLIRELRTLEPHSHFHPACTDVECPKLNGRHSLLYALDPEDHITRKVSRTHPAHETYMALKKHLRAQLQGIETEDDTNN